MIGPEILRTCFPNYLTAVYSGLSNSSSLETIRRSASVSAYAEEPALARVESGSCNGIETASRVSAGTVPANTGVDALIERMRIPVLTMRPGGLFTVYIGEPDQIGPAMVERA